tara:strand:+ start:105 stop:383 length:279 start_codon:yes stop_codon:yes gene_type:complete
LKYAFIHDHRSAFPVVVMCQSMSGSGNCYANAMAASFFHSLKTEEVYFQWHATRAQARASIFEYIEVFYNRMRRHSALGYRSPVEFMRKQAA